MRGVISAFRYAPLFIHSKEFPDTAPATALMSYCAERGAAVMPGIFIPTRELSAIPAIRAARAPTLIEVSKYFIYFTSASAVDCFSPPAEAPNGALH
jgi:hypothetical protein